MDNGARNMDNALDGALKCSTANGQGDNVTTGVGGADPASIKRETRSRTRRVVRVAVRWTVRIGIVAAVVLAVAFVVVFRGPLYNRFFGFPNEAKAWSELQDSRRDLAPPDGWQEFRGVLHSHSHFSHDSEVPFPEILEAAKEADIDFIFMSDHCVDGKADFSLQWRGLHDGVLFAPGFEMADGFMPFGLPSDTVLDCGANLDALAEQIETSGGLLFFAHSEEERRWDLPQLDGMEIYNIHTDFKGEGFGEILPDMILSLRRYPDQVLRLIFDRQDAILAHWDELNENRRIVGIAASDAHQNNGVRGYYTDRGTLLLRTTGTDEIGEYDLNLLTRGLLRLAFGPLEPDAQIFRIDLDPYARSLRFVNTHILARELSEESLLESLQQGRVFVAFDMLVDARGFSLTAENENGVAILGDTLKCAPDTRLILNAPVPCRFTVVHDGQVIAREAGRDYVLPISRPGKYRVEAELRIGKRWEPWVYTNPIDIVP